MEYAGTLPEHVDVLIVGAGISGIGMAHYLATDQPSRSFALVDGREAIGGTWDLFRYPGIRSDSDLHTFGYEFKPWTSDNAIADGHEILAYLQEVVDEDDLARRIHLGYKVIRAEWSSGEQRWTVTLQTAGGQQALISCSFLFSATGYYDYAGGHSPTFPHSEEFKGRIVHPQHWPEDLDYAGKNVVVIGSGATAVTLIPAMAEQVAHITMLQRSPSYVLAIPKQDPIANGLRKRLPDKLAYRITRGFNVRRQQFIYYMAQRRPDLVRKAIRGLVAGALPDGYDVDTHFNPHYKPWDQRLCMVPDGDLFTAIRDGKASVVTDHVDRFTETGILLASGKHLDADIIVTATGLKVLMLGGIELRVDDNPVVTNETTVYKSMMLSAVPNFAFLFGYTNISWTLKVDVVASHLVRLLDYMDRRGYTTVTPVNDDPTLTTSPLLDFGAGYVQRVLDELPRRGSHGPWTVEYYALDRKRLTGPVADRALRFGTAATANASCAPTAVHRVITPRFVTVSGRKTRVRVQGDGANPPVLLLHGISRSLEDWSAQFMLLAAKYRVIGLDLPGFGFSERKPEPATLIALADGVAETLDALGEHRPCHVIGNSLGGAVAVQLLAARPDRVASLTLVNSAGFGSEVTPLLRMLTVPGLGRFATSHSTAAGARVMERRCFDDPALVTGQRIEHALAIAAQPGNGAFLLEMANYLVTPSGVRQQWRRDLLDAVARHPRPTLIVWGDRDRVLPAHHLVSARRAFPDAQIKLFTGIGHMPQIECPEEFAQLIDGFLKHGPTQTNPVPAVPGKVGATD